MSMVVIARRTDSAVNTGLLGNFIAATDFGVSLYAQTGATSIIGGAGRVGDPAGTTAQGTGSIGTWTLGILSVPTIGVLTIYNKTSGITASSLATANREINGGGPMRIGADYNRSGANDIALAMFYDRAITLSEASTITTWARAYATRRGITV
ncbi:hypothetical protein [Pararhizobium gei]|uniref:hypothetical protein n=1 Tax=Pararhizobium gei TaxID=1395951 RepID=UPI0023DAB1A1|nr:hypothetical protein [Rhizobium gei]